MSNKNLHLGLYPGTFNPFHQGHQNILDKALKIFDKVFVVVGVNPDKVDGREVYTFPKHIKYIVYDGYMTTLVKRYRDDYTSVTLIRGVRNSSDYSYEMNNLAFMRELLPDIEVVFIPCDKQFEHISSSALRKLTEFGDDFKHHIIN